MLNQDWFAAAEDEIYPRWYRAGETLSGEMLQRATALGLIEDDKPARKAVRSAPQNKAR